MTDDTKTKADEKSTDENATAVPEASTETMTTAEEVDARSADQDHPTTTHRKEFVHGPGVYTKASGFSHEANIAATRQYLINSGLRPVGDVEHVSTKTHEDGVSKVLAYEVEAIPADEAEAYAVAHAEVIQADDGQAPATTEGRED